MQLVGDDLGVTGDHLVKMLPHGSLKGSNINVGVGLGLGLSLGQALGLDHVGDLDELVIIKLGKVGGHLVFLFVSVDTELSKAELTTGCLDLGHVLLNFFDVLNLKLEKVVDNLGEDLLFGEARIGKGSGVDGVRVSCEAGSNENGESHLFKSFF